MGGTDLLLANMKILNLAKEAVLKEIEDGQYPRLYGGPQTTYPHQLHPPEPRHDAEQPPWRATSRPPPATGNPGGSAGGASQGAKAASAGPVRADGRPASLRLARGEKLARRKADEKKERLTLFFESRVDIGACLQIGRPGPSLAFHRQTYRCDGIDLHAACCVLTATSHAAEITSRRGSSFPPRLTRPSSHDHNSSSLTFTRRQPSTSGFSHVLSPLSALW